MTSTENATETPKLELFGLAASPFVRKNLVVLKLKELPYTFTDLNPFTEKEKLTAMNPLAKIPVLLVDGEPKRESADINLFLESLKAEPSVFPTVKPNAAPLFGVLSWVPFGIFGGGTSEVATADELSRRIDKDWSAFNALVAQRAILPSMGTPTDEGVVKKAEEYAKSELQRFEKRVPKKDFAISTDLSVVDIGYGVWLRQLQLGGYEIDETLYPKTVAYLRRVYGTPGFKATIAFENEDGLIKSLKEQLTASFSKPMIE